MQSRYSSTAIELVRLVDLGDASRTENDRGNAALVDEMAHVAGERPGADRALAAALGEEPGHRRSDRYLRALPRAVVVVQELEPGGMVLEERVAGTRGGDAVAKTGHDLVHVADLRREIGAAAQHHLARRHRLVMAARDLADHEREGRLAGLECRFGPRVMLSLERDQSLDDGGQLLDGTHALLRAGLPARAGCARSARHRDLPI